MANNAEHAAAWLREQVEEGALPAATEVVEMGQIVGIRLHGKELTVEIVEGNPNINANLLRHIVEAGNKGSK